jgi:hypothetical protein
MGLFLDSPDHAVAAEALLQRMEAMTEIGDLMTPARTSWSRKSSIFSD